MFTFDFSPASFPGGEIEQASEQAGEEARLGWTEIRENWVGREEWARRGRGVIPHPAVSFVSRTFLETPTTQARNNRELKLAKRRTTAPYSWQYFWEKKKKTRELFGVYLSVEHFLSHKGRILLSFFYSSVLGDLTFREKQGQSRLCYNTNLATFQRSCY